MPCTASSATSYVTIAEGDDYFAAHPYATAWESATEEQKCRSIVQATRLIDASFRWIGYVASDAQPLAWPRYSVADAEGRWIAHTVIPNAIKYATLETAIVVLRRDVTQPTDADVQGISEMQAGPVKMKFRDRSPDAYAAFVFPDIVRNLLAPFVVQGTSSFGQIPLVRG
jgi:hypothetical protein